MISHLEGKLIHKSPTELVIDVGGVGYLVSIPLSTYERIEDRNGTVRVLTYMHVREDTMQLFGFASEAERSMFRMLLSVSGIGPKMAQGILSGLSTDEIKTAITGGDLTTLTSISGVGRKTAERLIVELRDKVAKTEALEPIPASTGQQLKARAEAVSALMSLGHSRASAESAIRAVLKEESDKEISIEELIKRALRHASK